MVFKLTPESKYIEELMELKSFCSNFIGDMKQVIADLNTNKQLDHDNDLLTAEVIEHLVSATSACNRKNYKDLDKYLQSALQKIHQQQKIDLEDDKPRTDARIKLSTFSEKALNQEQRITDLLKEIKELKNKK